MELEVFNSCIRLDSPAKTDEKQNGENAALQGIFQLGEQMKMVFLMAVYSQFTDIVVETYCKSINHFVFSLFF